MKHTLSLSLSLSLTVPLSQSLSFPPTVSDVLLHMFRYETVAGTRRSTLWSCPLRLEELNTKQSIGSLSRNGGGGDFYRWRVPSLSLTHTHTHSLSLSQRRAVKRGILVPMIQRILRVYPMQQTGVSLSHTHTLSRSLHLLFLP